MVKVVDQDDESKKKLDAQKKAKRFVTVLAWILIAFFGYSLLNAAVQTIMFANQSPMEYIRNYLPDEEINVVEMIPPIFKPLLNDYYMELSIFSIVWSLFFIIPSIYLLKRRNWARIFWVIMMLASIVVVVLPFFFIDQFIPQLPPEIANPQIQKTMNATVYISFGVMDLIIIIFHSWVAYKLCSKDVKTQFIPKSEQIPNG